METASSRTLQSYFLLNIFLFLSLIPLFILKLIFPSCSPSSIPLPVSRLRNSCSWMHTSTYSIPLIQTFQIVLVSSIMHQITLTPTSLRAWLSEVSSQACLCVCVCQSVPMCLAESQSAGGFLCFYKNILWLSGCNLRVCENVLGHSLIKGQATPYFSSAQIKILTDKPISCIVEGLSINVVIYNLITIFCFCASNSKATNHTFRYILIKIKLPNRTSSNKTNNHFLLRYG